MKVSEIKYYPRGRYSAEDLSERLSDTAKAAHDLLTGAGFSASPHDDDAEGQGVQYHRRLERMNQTPAAPGVPFPATPEWCGDIRICYYRDADGWRACIEMPKTGVIAGDSEVAAELADSLGDACEHLVDRMHDELGRGAPEERAEIGMVLPLVEAALDDVCEDEED